MSMPTEAEIAWAAGIFEGEGTMVAIKNTGCRLSIEMTDRDVLERFQEIVGGGTIGTKILVETQPQWKPRWTWYIQRGAEAERVITLLMPWFLGRRKAKAEEMLERLSRNPGANALKTHCPYGHAYTEDNIYTARGWNIRQCRTCVRKRAHERYHRLKAAAS